jgi:hypothetical protein
VEVEWEMGVSLLVVGVAALGTLVDVGMDARGELEEVEVVANGFAGGLGRERVGAGCDCRAGSTEGSEVGVVAVPSTDGRTVVILDNTL